MSDSAAHGPASDAGLVRRLRAGDAGAFDAVYQRYHARVYGFLVRMAGRREVADDLAQDTWMRFATHAHTLRDDARLGPWLFAVARNLVLTQRRRQSLDAQGADELGHAATDAAVTRGATDPSSPYQHAAATELERQLESALASLAPSYREVILLVAVEGLAPAEAARVLHVAPEAVRQRLARARAMVQEYLGKSERGRDTPRAGAEVAR